MLLKCAVVTTCEKHQSKMEKFAVIFVLFGLALGSDVLDLSDGGFEAEAKGRDIMLVEFFAPW